MEVIAEAEGLPRSSHWMFVYNSVNTHQPGYAVCLTKEQINDVARMGHSVMCKYDELMIVPRLCLDVQRLRSENATLQAENAALKNHLNDIRRIVDQPLMTTRLH